MLADLFRQLAADQTAGTIPLERNFLLVGKLHFPTYRADFVWLDGETRAPALPTIVDVDASEPLRHHHRPHTGNPLDLLAIGFRHGEHERDFVYRGEPQRLLRTGFTEVKSGIDRHENS